jgi:hypothetical protein
MRQLAPDSEIDFHRDGVNQARRRRQALFSDANIVNPSVRLIIFFRAR